MTVFGDVLLYSQSDGSIWWPPYDVRSLLHSDWLCDSRASYIKGALGRVSISMSPEAAKFLAWLIGTIAKLDGKEAAITFVNTLLLVLEEDGASVENSDAVKQTAYSYIDEVVNETANTATAAHGA